MNNTNLPLMSMEKLEKSNDFEKGVNIVCYVCNSHGYISSMNAEAAKAICERCPIRAMMKERYKSRETK